jgi:hypothetical protein
VIKEEAKVPALLASAKIEHGARKVAAAIRNTLERASDPGLLPMKRVVSLLFPARALCFRSCI